MSESSRPEPRMRTLPTGDVVREASDGRFVSSPSGTVHERDECDHSFSEVHDKETLEQVGEECLHCRKRRECPDPIL